MSEEIRDTIQVIEFTGRTVAALIKGGVFLGGGAINKGVKFHNWSQAKRLQKKLKLHYADKGMHSSLSLKDMEKLTGGNYRILKIPMERGVGKTHLSDIEHFFDALKTLKIPFSELPDLHTGDGFIELAYNGLDAEKLRDFLDEYSFPGKGEAKETTLEEYFNNATPEKEEELTKNALANLRKEQGVSEEVQKKNYKKYQGTLDKLDKRSNYKKMLATKGCREITINKKMITGETETHFLTVIPGTKGQELLSISKESAYWVDENKTLVTVLNMDKKYNIHSRRGQGQQSKNGKELFRHYDRVERNVYTPKMNTSRQTKTRVNTAKPKVR